MHDKRVPAESLYLILLPVESQQEAESRGQPRQGPIFVDSRFGRKHEIADSLDGTQI